MGEPTCHGRLKCVSRAAAIDPKLDIVHGEDDRTIVAPELVVHFKGLYVVIIGRYATSFSRRGCLVASGLHCRRKGAARPESMLSKRA